MTLTLDGPLDAPLLVCGRDPGAQEVFQGRPFVGDSGHLLDRALARTPLPRARVAVTNVVGQRPAGNLWTAHTPGNVEQGVAALRARLESRVFQGRPVVLACGEQATLACLGYDPRESLADALGEPITVLRGYPFYGHAGCVVVPTVHPAFMLHGQGGGQGKGNWLPWWPLFCWDAAKAVRLALAGGWAPPQAEDEGVARVERPWREALAGGEGLLAVDIETSRAVGPECIGFAGSALRGCAFPFAGNEEVARAILASPRPKVFHNGQFDVTVLERFGYEVRGWAHDTQLLWHAAEPVIAGQGDGSSVKNKRTEKSLRLLASVLTDTPFWKNYNFSSKEEQWKLCATDARVTWACAQVLLGRLTGVSLPQGADAVFGALPEKK